MNYSDLTRRYFQTTPAAGVLGRVASPESGFFRGSAGSRERGTWVQFDIQVQHAQIMDARFLAYACPHVIAAASWVAEHGRGSLAAALPEPVHALRARFEVPQEKLGKLLILEDAWVAATRAAVESRAFKTRSTARVRKLLRTTFGI